jgi:Flp pilus assembly protein TadG
MIEFALALPMLLLVVAGICTFGLAFDNYSMLTEATAVGARQLAISRGQTLDPCQTVANAVYAAAPLLTPSSMTFRISLNGTPYAGTSCAGTTTSGAPFNMVLGSNAVVTVTYPFNLPVFRNFVTANYTLTAQTAELMQ